jgi:hypothetical protein
MSDENDSGGYSYSLGGSFQPTPGLSTGNLGDYSLGSGLGSTGEGGDNGPTFGSSHFTPEQQTQYLNNLYNNPDFTLNSLYGSINSPLLGENEKVNWQNLDTVKDELNKLPKIATEDLGEQGDDPTKGAFGWFRPGSLGYRWGLRDPGSAAARDPFSYETLSERDDRMGLVGKTLGTIGNAALSAVTPAPISMALAGLRGYQDYQKNGDLSSALGQALGGVGGYVGAAGQALQGNYGSALTGALSKGGASPLASLVAGTGVDYSQGKDVTNNLGGIAGYTLGTAAGKGYGGFGQSLGTSLAKTLYGKK